MVNAVISEGILLVASVIVASGLSFVVMGKVNVFQSAFTMSTESGKEIVLTKIKILYATNSSSNVVKVWVKNTGVTPIKNISSGDVYFGKLGSVERIPYNNPSAPTWTYSGIQNPARWNEMETMQIDITDINSFQKGITYMIRVITSNGVSDDYIFSIS